MILSLLLLIHLTQTIPVTSQGSGTILPGERLQILDFQDVNMGAVFELDVDISPPNTGVRIIKHYSRSLDELGSTTKILCSEDRCMKENVLRWEYDIMRGVDLILEIYAEYPESHNVTTAQGSAQPAHVEFTYKERDSLYVKSWFFVVDDYPWHALMVISGAVVLVVSLSIFCCCWSTITSILCCVFCCCKRKKKKEIVISRPMKPTHVATISRPENNNEGGFTFQNVNKLMAADPVPPRRRKKKDRAKEVLLGRSVEEMSDYGTTTTKQKNTAGAKRKTKKKLVKYPEVPSMNPPRSKKKGKKKKKNYFRTSAAAVVQKSQKKKMSKRGVEGEKELEVAVVSMSRDMKVSERVQNGMKPNVLGHKLVGMNNQNNNNSGDVHQGHEQGNSSHGGVKKSYYI